MRILRKALCALGLHAGEEETGTYKVISDIRWLSGSCVIQRFSCCGRTYIKEWLG